MPRDSLTAEVLVPFLSRLRLGRPLHAFISVTSTMDEARRIAGDSPEGTLLIAEEQTKGRGRGGAGWLSPTGMGLWLSVILRPARPPVDWPVLCAVSGLSLVRALEDLYELSAQLKWPNDVWIGHRKLAGFLAESQPAAGWVILGAGINVHQDREGFPSELQDRVTSLAQALGPEVPSRPILLTQFLRRLQQHYDEFTEHGPEVFRDRFREKEILMGRGVRLHAGDETVEGVVEDLGPRCELLLRLQDGTRRAFRSGHVELVSGRGSS